MSQQVVTPTAVSQVVGQHYIAEMTDCDIATINDEQTMCELLESAARAGGATVLKTTSHAFEPQGVTAICLLAESHLSIHTWPEIGYAAVDLFTCGTSADPDKIITIISKAIGAHDVQARKLNRGSNV